jgi:hypothetical protein
VRKLRPALRLNQREDLQRLRVVVSYQPEALDQETTQHERTVRRAGSGGRLRDHVETIGIEPGRAAVNGFAIDSPGGANQSQQRCVPDAVPPAGQKIASITTVILARVYVGYRK